MTEQQIIMGLFDNAAEAQQAVQLLLAGGFTPQAVALSMRTDPSLTATGGVVEPDSSSGRFYSSLFGGKPDSRLVMGQPGADGHRWAGSLVTVKTQSASEASRVAELLDAAGAGEVIIEDNG